MKIVILVLFLACVAFSQARFFEDDFESEETEIDLYESDDSRDLDLGHKGHCTCCSHGCWCHGHAGAFVVSITMQVDEADQGSVTQVLASIDVDRKYHFHRKFAVDKVDDFCETVNGKQICFDFDIKSNGGSNGMLKGCVKLTRPEKVDLGCFNLPLLASGDDFTSYDESETESEDNTLFFE